MFSVYFGSWFGPWFGDEVALGSLSASLSGTSTLSATLSTAAEPTQPETIGQFYWPPIIEQRIDDKRRIDEEELIVCGAL